RAPPLASARGRRLCGHPRERQRPLEDPDGSGGRDVGYTAMIQDTCLVCLQSLSDRAVLFEDVVWRHAPCWPPLRALLDQTEARELTPDERPRGACHELPALLEIDSPRSGEAAADGRNCPRAVSGPEFPGRGPGWAQGRGRRGSGVPITHGQA